MKRVDAKFATEWSRRDLLCWGAAGVLAAGVSGATAKPSFAADGPTRPLRFVHLTDIHVQPELSAERGFRQCIAKVNELDPQPAFIITGGDLVMDVLAVSYERAQMLWNLFNDCCRDFTVPVYHTIGNHDILGWASKGKVLSTVADYGKRIFTDHVGQGRTYRSFDHGGWHFVLLDSIEAHDNPSGYQGQVNEEQLEWLKGDLAAAGKDRPTVVVVHIPLFSTWTQLSSGSTAPVSPGALVTNAHLVRKVLEQYQVPLVLQGHNHIRERIEYSDTAYITSGAVSGGWWKGSAAGEHPEGFAIVDLLPDGSFRHTYQTYGWKAVKS